MDYVEAVNNILKSKEDEEDDLYNILGCNENSSEEQINAEFKARVLSCHPDKNPEDKKAHETFAKLSKAKDTLLDPEKRRDYDKWRRSQLAVTYEQWRSMPHVKTSMHWGVPKRQTAISNPSECSQMKSVPRSPQPAEEEESEHLQELREKMKFRHREQHLNQPSSLSGWKRDTSNPMLEKFRNYEI